MVCQAFVRGLNGRSRCLQLDANSVTAQEILNLVLPSSISSTDFILYTGTRVLSPDSTLTVDSDGFFPSCHVSCRLLGGKGGFGSLLRGAATRAGQKKTTNFDACRDMSGRRLRHVNAEKKLKDWRHEAKERNLEKVAQDYIKKLAKEKRKVEREVTITGEMKLKSEEAMDRVAEAVKLGMQSSKNMSDVERKRKRAALAEGHVGGSSGGKKLLGLELGAMAEEEDEEESEDSEESEEESEEEEEEEVEEEEEEGGGDRSKEEEASRGRKRVKADGVSCTPITGLTSDLTNMAGSPQQSLLGLKKEVSLPELVMSAAQKPGSSSSSTQANSGSASPEPAGLETKGMANVPKPTCADGFGILATEGILWEKVASSAELEVVGLEVLKTQLQKSGLKCGGTLQERAARLFLLKDTPLEKIDKKHLAKPSGKK